MTAVEQRCGAILQQLYDAPKIGVEVGVYKGWLSRLLLIEDPTLFLYLVDSWKAVNDSSYNTTDDFIARFTQAQHDEAMAETVSNVEQFEGRVQVMRMDSDEAASCFKDGELDFVFIDADHSYEGCLADIRRWWPKVRKRGIVSGHDFREERGYGVIKAVEEFCRDNQLGEIRLGPNYTWFLTR